MFKKIDKNIFSAILYIVVGALLIIFKAAVVDWAMYIVGAIFIVSGILDVLKRNYTGGGISLVIGLVICLLGWALKEIVLLVLGILIAVKGVIALIDALKKKKHDVVEIAFTILTIVTGAMLAFGNGLDIILVIAGILLAVDGAIGLLAALRK